MKYSCKLDPEEWVVMYSPEDDALALTPKRKNNFYDFPGWYLIGDL